ncbi:MAG: formylglycine-generating enzyme family protein [Candidatus Scalindua sp.]|nr:formylglycine-generating enzyme family protein [Candidatus Scalindua sp.]
MGNIISKNEIIHEKDGALMAYVPAGPFFMWNEKKSIEIREFYIDKYPITNKQYRKFIEETGHDLPAFWEDEKFNNPEQPVVGVSWDDATAYANWAGKRLPEEKEWEKAARGTDGREYPWGNMKPDEGLAVFDLESSRGFPSVVGKHPLGASPYGCHDMSGNVWEWCQEWYSVGKYRVVRGGSWINHMYALKCSYRSCSVPSGKDNNVGFRCVKDA